MELSNRKIWIDLQILNMMKLYTCSSNIIGSYDKNGREWTATLMVNVFMLHAHHVIGGKHVIYIVRI